jgi:iron complex outermembrane receptor protein
MTLQTKARLLASGALLLAAAIGTSAHAQSKQATTAAAAAASTNTIEELVVTAEKRAQNLQDVPIAISAFTSEKRDLIGINTIQDMTNFTPGLNYTSANDRTTIRGIGRLTNQHSIGVPVAVYDDGIYTTSTVTAGKSPIFTDRVEVLRGPQGTLYGRNSLGGAINVISKRPTEDPYGEIRVQIGNYGWSQVEAAVSGPLEPGLQFRLAGNWQKQRDGFFTNIVPGMPSQGGVIDQFFLEGQLQAKFGDHADAWMKVFTAGWNNGSGGPGAQAGYSNGPIGVGMNGATNFNAGIACAPGGVVSNVVNTSPLGCLNPANTDPRKFASNYAQTVSLDETYGLSFQFAYHFDGFDVKYIGGGLNYHYTLDSDNGGGSISKYDVNVLPFNPAVPIASQPCAATNLAHPGACPNLTIFPYQYSTYQEDYHNYSHELNIASTNTGPIQWIGGLYYYKEGIKQPVFTVEPQQPQLGGTVANGPMPFQHHVYDNRPDMHEESYAVYGQADWKFLPEWTLTLGLRYNHDRKFGTETVRVLCYAAPLCTFPANTLGATFTPLIDSTAAVVYTASLPQGVVPGGVNGSGVTFGPDGFASRSYDASWDDVTGQAVIKWDPDRDTNVYFRYGRGYLAGGFGVGITTTLGQFPYTDKENVDDFELGLKKEFFDHTLQVNLAIFHDEIKGYQAPLTVVNNSGGLAVSQSRTLNVPKSYSQGVEIEAVWQPIDHLSLSLSYGFNDTSIETLTNIIDGADPEALDKDAKPIGPLITCANRQPTDLPCDTATGYVQRAQNLKGNGLPQAPRNKVALNANYTWIFEPGSLTPSVSYVWRDKQYAGLFTRDYNASPAWDQWDARVTWKSKDNHYSIIAYIKNIGDTLGYDGGAGTGRITGLYLNSTLTALGINTPCVAPAVGQFTPCRGTTSTSLPGGVASNALQGYSKSFALTPPRTYGIELQYRF